MTTKCHCTQKVTLVVAPTWSHFMAWKRQSPYKSDGNCWYVAGLNLVAGRCPMCTEVILLGDFTQSFLHESTPEWESYIDQRGFKVRLESY